MNNEQKVKQRMDKYSVEVTTEELFDLFEKVKDSYNAKTPDDIINRFKNGDYSIDSTLISKMMILRTYFKSN